MQQDSKPSLAIVMEGVSGYANKWGWQNVEEFLNPCGAFRAVHVIAIGDKHVYDTTRFGTVQIHPIPPRFKTPGLRRFNDAIGLLIATRRLWTVAREEKIDLLAQTWGTPLKFGLPAVFVAGRLGLPSVITLCNDYERLEALTYSPPLRWLSGLLWPYLFSRCSRVRSKSQYISDFAFQRGASTDKVRVIPNKEILEKFQSPPSEREMDDLADELEIRDLVKDSVVFFTAARVIKAKNFDRMLQAFALACRKVPNMSYLIAGRGPLLEDMKALARDLALESRVRFVGYFPHEKLRLLYRLSDVFLFPTLYEGQPRAVIEAMLSKLPIICANYGNVCDIVGDGEDGIWVDPLDIEDIAQAIVRLGTETETRDRMSRHLTFDAGRYALNSVGAQEVRLYLEAIEAHSNGATSAIQR